MIKRASLTVLYRRPARRPIAPPRVRRPVRRHPRPQRPKVLFVAAAVGLAVIAGTVVGVLETGAGPATPPGLLARFEVVYRVMTATAGPAQTTWEVLEVSDPLDVSDLTYDRDPLSGAQPAGGTVTTFDHLYNLAGGSLKLVSDRQPVLGSGDQALVPELPDLERRGLALALGDRRLFGGQTCSTYRLSQPPAGSVTPLSGADHDDICLSGSGLELAETWTFGGRAVLQRTAIEVTVGGSDRRIVGAPAASPAQPSTQVLRVGPPTQASFLAAPPPPAGFTGMKAVQAIANSTSTPNQVVDLSTIWAFRRAGDIVTVEAGEGQLPWDNGATPVSPLHLAGLGEAQSVLRSGGPEIQVQLSGGRWVRIDGTVPLSYLAGYAGRLRL